METATRKDLPRKKDAEKDKQAKKKDKHARKEEVEQFARKKTVRSFILFPALTTLQRKSASVARNSVIAATLQGESTDADGAATIGRSAALTQVSDPSAGEVGAMIRDTT
jgi:hypothetical protein